MNIYMNSQFGEPVSQNDTSAAHLNSANGWSLNHLRLKTFSIFFRKTLLRWSLLGDTNDTGGIKISEAIAPPPSYGQLFVIF